MDGLNISEFVPGLVYLCLGIAGLYGVSLWFRPVYGVWKARKYGEAQLAQAQFGEQVAIAEANARLKAATMNKEAEIIEAEAVAKSIETIGEALSQNEGYLRWQWIKMMDDTEHSVIYVPTEANLPILESGKRRG